MVEVRFEVRHKVGEDGYCITELRVEGVEELKVEDMKVVFRTSVQLSVDLTKEEVDLEKVAKETEYIRNILNTKAENFRSNVQKLRGMLSVLGEVAEKVVYI